MSKHQSSQLFHMLKHPNNKRLPSVAYVIWLMSVSPAQQALARGLMDHLPTTVPYG